MKAFLKTLLLVIFILGALPAVLFLVAGYVALAENHPYVVLLLAGVGVVVIAWAVHTGRYDEGNP